MLFIKEKSHTLTVGDVYFAAGVSGETPFRKGCTGQELSKSDYPELFEAIGDTYGTPTDETKFKTPSLRGRFIQGSFWSERGQYISAGLPNITGRLTDTPSASGSGCFQRSGTSNWKAMAEQASGGSKYGTTDFSAKNSNSIYGNSSTVQPPALTLYPVVCSKSNSYVAYCFRRTA